MSKFKVGDHVIGQNFKNSLCRNGMEGHVTKIGPLPSIRKSGEIVPSDYSVSWVDGREGGCDEHNLRKRRPPQDNLFTEWFQSHIITDPICVPSKDEVAKFDMTNVFRSIKYRPADLKPIERIDTTSREEGNGG